jgi:hypothetical protein
MLEVNRGRSACAIGWMWETSPFFRGGLASGE